jgi:hypothetical protein
VHLLSTTYRIVCVDKAHEPTHHHIVKVGTVDAADASSQEPNRFWTVAEVREALQNGDQFFTEDPSIQRPQMPPLVEAVDCPEPDCPGQTIRTIKTQADASRDDNLDNLPSCSGH